MSIFRAAEEQCSDSILFTSTSAFQAFCKFGLRRAQSAPSRETIPRRQNDRGTQPAAANPPGFERQGVIFPQKHPTSESHWILGSTLYKFLMRPFFGPFPNLGLDFAMNTSLRHTRLSLNHSRRLPLWRCHVVRARISAL